MTVKDINAVALPQSGAPAGLARIGSRVLFSANDGSTGAELWMTNGTAAGTVLVKDIWPGASGSSPAILTVLGNKVVFSANDGTIGTELWSISLTALDASEAGSFGVNCKGALNPTIGSSGAPALGNATFAVTLANMVASSPASLFLAGVRADLPFAGCTIYPSLTPTINFNIATNGSGDASMAMPIPAAPVFVGVPFFFQWVVVDIGGPILGVASLSDGLRISIGKS